VIVSVVLEVLMGVRKCLGLVVQSAIGIDPEEVVSNKLLDLSGIPSGDGFRPLALTFHDKAL
jgi:hypothetical protein